MMEEEINHVSHKEHPLKLVEVGDDDDDEEQKVIVCAFCEQIISDGRAAYACNKCRYFMHKACAELKPLIINNHPLHPQHALKLMVVAEKQTPYEYGRQHPLKVTRVGSKRTVGCGFCKQGMSKGSVAYGCVECDDYLMHKTCAQLEPRINHHLHPQHPLILTLQALHPQHPMILALHAWKSRPSLYDCDACGVFQHYPKYTCSACSWNACNKCVAEVAAFKDDDKVQHPPHTLVLRLSKPATFPCDACKTADDKDFLYQCTDCPFLIHKTCATLAPEIRLPHHHGHPLLLAYQVPEKFVGESYDCAFCKGKLIQSGYVYHCLRCRYFAHTKCVLNAPR